MSRMFYKCSSLKELKFSNFYINNNIDMFDIFLGCPDKLKEKFEHKNKNVKYISKCYLF